MAGDGQTPGAGARCGCGRAVEPGHRFCPACGSLVGHLTGGEAEADTGTVLLDPASGGAPDPAVVDGAVRTGRSTTARLAVIGSIVVLGLLAWGLFRQPSGEIAPDPPSGDDAAADDGEGDDGDRTTTTRRRTTRRSRSTTTTEATTTVLTRADGSPGPLLGEETGLTLAFGSMERRGIQLLDLDSGELEVRSQLRGQPIGHMGSNLVLFGENGRPRLVDLDDPEAGEVRLSGAGWGQVTLIEEDRLWLLEEGADGVSLVAFDETGREVGRNDAATRGLVGWYAFGPSVGRPPELVARPGAGLYRQEGEGYRLVARGQALAVGERLALMEECDDAMICRARWIDVGTGGVVDHPVPDPLDGGTYLAVVGDDRWLLAVDWQVGQASLADIPGGGIVWEFGADRLFGPFGPSAVISDDGRWLLDPSGVEPVVVDLDTGNEWPLEGLRVGPSSGAAFVPTVG